MDRCGSAAHPAELTLSGALPCFPPGMLPGPAHLQGHQPPTVALALLRRLTVAQDGTLLEGARFDPFDYWTDMSDADRRWAAVAVFCAVESVMQCFRGSTRHLPLPTQQLGWHGPRRVPPLGAGCGWWRRAAAGAPTPTGCGPRLSRPLLAFCCSPAASAARPLRKSAECGGQRGGGATPCRLAAAWRRCRPSCCRASSLRRRGPRPPGCDACRLALALWCMPGHCCTDTVFCSAHTVDSALTAPPQQPRLRRPLHSDRLCGRGSCHPPSASPPSSLQISAVTSAAQGSAVDGA